MPDLTLSGNEITDALRALGVQGDGRTDPDSSMGIWEAMTNLVTNGGFETNTTGWVVDSSTIARSTAQAKFGAASLALTSTGATGWGATRAGVSGAPLSVLTYSWSCWVLGSGASIGKSCRLRSIALGGAQAAAVLGSATVTLTAAWQRVTLTATVDFADRTSFNFEIWMSTAAAGAGEVFYLDGAQLEQQPLATPYVETDGGTASRSAARVRAPASLIDETQGWAAFRLRAGWVNTADPSGNPTLLQWKDDASNLLELRYDTAANLWELQRRNGGGTGEATVADTFALDAAVTVIAAWTATALKVSVDGGAFSSVAATNIPTLAATTWDIGSSAGTAEHIDSDLFWVACGTGTLTNANAATIHGYGNNDPNLDFPVLPGTPTMVWAADTSYYDDTAPYVLLRQTTLYPYVKVEVEFATAPTSAAATWTEITPYVLSFSCRRGRQHDLARIEAGTLDMRLDNRDRRFDPSYTSSPYSPNVVPLRRIRVRASWNYVTYPVWQGYVEAWPPSWPDGGLNDVVTLRAVDGFKVLNLSSLRSASFSSENTGTRISNVLGTVSIPSADYSVGAGSVTLVASGTVSDDTTALGHILEVVDSEGGGAVFYASRGGTFIYENQRHRIANETVSSGTYVDSAGTTGLTYRDLLASYDDADLWNQVTITPSGGTAETIDDTGSQTSYFKRALSLSGLHARQGEAAAVASIITYRQADPQLRFPTMEVVGAANPSVLWPKLLALEISDRLTVSRTPPGGGAVMSQDCHVEAVDHEIGTDHWTTRLQLSKADAASTFWVLGTNTLETGASPAIVGY